MDKGDNLKRIMVGILALLAACSPGGPTGGSMKNKDIMSRVAEPYIKLALALGRYDKDYVDAYYGSDRLRAEGEGLSLEEIGRQCQNLLKMLESEKVHDDDALMKLRHDYLSRQLNSMLARIEMVSGRVLPFDEETRRLYDAVAPTYDRLHFQELLDELSELVPGAGPLQARVESWREQFVIPKDKLDDVFKAAITEARKRTLLQVELPESESFIVEYVSDKPWSGYNWYQGKYQSIIQVNTDFPIYIDRAIDLACHEGYPGHHVYNAMLEKKLVNDRGWLEYTIYPLFSPQSLIAEGTANFGIEVAFPMDDRIAFEKEILFPLAGLDPESVEHYYKVMDVLARLNYAGNEAARGYLNGEMSREQAHQWLVEFGLFSPDRARQRLSFIEKYRGYVINYNLGQDLVADYVIRNGGSEDQPDRRWAIFRDLISSPRLPSGLIESEQVVKEDGKQTL